jgi:PAS domain S-box-containing protein
MPPSRVIGFNNLDGAVASRAMELGSTGKGLQGPTGDPFPNRIFREIFEDFPYPSVTYGLKGGTYVHANRAFQRAFGISSAELVGRPLDEVAFATDRELLVTRMIASGGFAGDLSQFVTRDGALITARAFGFPVGMDDDILMVALLQVLYPASARAGTAAWKAYFAERMRRWRPRAAGRI